MQQNHIKTTDPNKQKKQKIENHFKNTGKTSWEREQQLLTQSKTASQHTINNKQANHTHSQTEPLDKPNNKNKQSNVIYKASQS